MNRELLQKLAVHYLAPILVLPPTSVFISPTLRCSSKCFHCGVWRDRKKIVELSPTQWERLLDDPYLVRARTLWFSGGEPFLRADLAELARRTTDALPGLKSFTVATNALHPFRLETFLETVLPAFKNRGIYCWIHLSLDGPARIHDQMRGVEGAFHSLERAVIILRRIKESGANIGWGFNCVLTGVNAQYIAETEKIASGMGGEITFNLALPEGGFYRGSGSGELNAEDRSTIKPLIEQFIRRDGAYYRRFYESVLDVLERRPRRRRCETLEATLYLDPDGSAYPCPYAYDEFRVETYPGGMQDVWKRLAKYRSYIRRRFCPDCSLGCSFGEGISLSELMKLGREGLL